jgi:LacI family transcriptional regulator
MTAREIGLLIETSTVHGRGLLRGVLQFVATERSWRPHVIDRGVEGFFAGRGRASDVRRWLGSRRFDGLIGRFDDDACVDAAAALGVPVVSLVHARASVPFPVVEADNEAVARLAAGHLLERGFERFAFCGRARVAWSERRGSAFVAAVEASGHRCDCLEPLLPPEATVSWQDEVDAVVRWLARVDPQPLGVMACNDEAGRVLLEACRIVGRAVPDDVAVIGVDDDDVLCDLSPIPLSSVGLDSVGTGRRAAELLKALLDGGAAPSRVMSVAPTGVVGRLSTDVFVSRDRHVAQAIRFIRHRAFEGIGAADVAAAVPLSRRALEVRFSRVLGRTILDEIQRVRLERVKLLLRTTGLSLADICEQAGLVHVEHLSRLFKKKVGCSPSSYRQQQRRTG